MRFVLAFMTIGVALFSLGCGQNIEKVANDVPAVEEAAFREVTPAEAQAAVEKSKVQFIDVRGDVEFSVRHAPRSVNIPLGQLDAKIAELDRNAPTYVICEVGQRSKTAAAQLKKAGFNDVYHVTGGIQEWVKAGLPVEGEVRK